MADSLFGGTSGELSQWVKIPVNIFANKKLIFAVFLMVTVGCVSVILSVVL